MLLGVLRASTVSDVGLDLPLSRARERVWWAARVRKAQALLK